MLYNIYSFFFFSFFFFYLKIHRRYGTACLKQSFKYVTSPWDPILAKNELTCSRIPVTKI